MENKAYTLQEAATLLGWDYDRLKTMARRGKVPTVDIPYGQARFKKGITADTLALLRQGEAQDRYADMVAIYIGEMRGGVWDGKGRVLTEQWIKKLQGSLDRYWSVLGVKPSIVGVNAQNFKTVMASFLIDREKKRDYYTTKMNIYKAVTGLMKVLIREGFKTKADTEAIREYRPGRVFQIKKDFLDLPDVERALEINLSWKKGRSDYDVRAMDMLLSLYAFAGLRRIEVAMLRLDQVHLDKGYLHVYGKWSKERIVPIFPALREKLTAWLPYRGERVTSQYLVPQAEGTQMTDGSISTRFHRFQTRAKMPQITPHALRRSCATIASVHGMPDGLIQRMLGHKHATTTEGYKQVQDRHLVEWAQTFDFGRVKPPIQPAAESAPMQTDAPKELDPLLFW